MNDFINKLRSDGSHVRIWTTNGAQLVGTIASAEADHIVLDINGVGHMIFKHAISTIRAED